MQANSGGPAGVAQAFHKGVCFHDERCREVFRQMNRLDSQTPGVAWQRPPVPQVGEVRFGDAFFWLIVVIPACFLLFTLKETVPTISLLSSIIIVASLALVA